MRPPRYRAWQFALPTRDPESDEAGPFTLTTRAAAAEHAGLQLSDRGAIAMVEERDSVRQAILLLIATVPGERVMRPDYGCDLQQLVFSPNDDTTAGLAMHYVRRALERWEPRIEVLRLDADRHEVDPYSLHLFLEYRLRSTRHIENLVIPLLLSGEQAA